MAQVAEIFLKLAASLSCFSLFVMEAIALANESLKNETNLVTGSKCLVE
jgi:hypothetical protein